MVTSLRGILTSLLFLRMTWSRHCEDEVRGNLLYDAVKYMQPSVIDDFQDKLSE